MDKKISFNEAIAMVLIERGGVDSSNFTHFNRKIRAALAKRGVTDFEKLHDLDHIDNNLIVVLSQMDSEN